MNVTASYLLDDIDGSPADRTVQFALGDAQYEIDLNERNVDALRTVLERYIAAARPVDDTASPASAKLREASRSAYRARIRQWARDTGQPIFGHGKIPHRVVEAYERSMAALRLAAVAPALL